METIRVQPLYGSTGNGSTAKEKFEMVLNRYALRAIRESHGITLTDMAEAVGLSLPMLSRIESGERNASAARIRQMASVLGVSPLAISSPADPEAVEVAE
jgi:transcriptional regulator with XRE-family HTH domain